MIRDYGNRRGMARTGRGPRGSGGSWLAGVGVGQVLPALALVGLLLTLVLGWSLRGAQQQVAQEQARQQQLLSQHRELEQRRDDLQARERIELEAARLGLHPPGPGQVQRMGR